MIVGCGPTTLITPAGWIEAGRSSALNTRMAVFYKKGGGPFVNVEMVVPANCVFRLMVFKDAGEIEALFDHLDASPEDTEALANSPDFNPVGGLKDYYWISSFVQDKEFAPLLGPALYLSNTQHRIGIGTVLGWSDRVFYAACQNPGPWDLGGFGSWSATTIAVYPEEESAFYSTDFPLTENPILGWTTGLQDGLDWTDPQTANGRAFGTMTDLTKDSIGHLNGFADDHYVEAVLYDGAPANGMKAELLLRFDITPNSATGYMVLIRSNGAVSLIRWNGPVNNLTNLESWSFGGTAHADIWRASIVGTLITVTKNGGQSEIYDISSDSTQWLTGNPGMAFYNKFPIADDLFGWSSFEAGDL